MGAIIGVRLIELGISKYFMPHIQTRCCTPFAFDVSTKNDLSCLVSSANYSLMGDWQFCPYCGEKITYVNGGTP